MNRIHFGHISARAASAKRNLEILQFDILRNGGMPVKYPEIRRKREMLLEADRLFLAQKSKCTYLMQNDMCTKFFHDLIKINNKKNAIVSLALHDGSSTVDSLNISHEFVQHFRDLLGVKVGIMSAGPRILEEDFDSLIDPVLDDEIKATLFDIDKAPGSDGFGSFFYKSAWDRTFV